MPNGSYTYQSTANNITADTTDVFVYTIKDGDGDLSTTTLTINLANVTLSATDTDALVNEAGLPVIGSDAASNSEIFNGSITPSGGTGPFTFALTSPATGQPRHAGAERRDRDLHLYADHAVRHHAGQHDNGGADRAGQGQLQLHGDRRPRQQRHRHDPGRHHRRRSDGACGQRQCGRGRAADGCGVWGAGRTTLPARTALRPAAGLSGFARRAAT